MLDSKKHDLSSVAAEDDVVSTPEGDNEYQPGEPVGPADGLQVPSGNAPIPYDADVDRGAGGDAAPRDDDRGDRHEKGIIEKTFDKLSIGQILT